MRLLETDTATNTSIAAATQVASYTADAARHVLVRVLIDQAAGAGDYIVYCKVQRGGSGSSYVMIPKTTGTAASGETAIGFASIPLPVSSGDVVTVWVDGLAGDTTTPDIITDWYEVDTLRPTTADRTLDVSATGEAGVDWANVGTPGSTVALTATTVGTATTVTGVAAGGITAASIATGAIDADSLAADAVAEIADTVLRRTMANIEASAYGDTLSVESLYGLLATSFEAALASTTLTIRKSDGTTLGTKTLTVDAAAVPVTGIT